MSNKEKSVETMPKSNGPVATETIQNDTIKLTEPTADEIKTDNKRGNGSNNKKKDKHKNKDETRTNNNNNNANNNNNKTNSKAKSPKTKPIENGMKTPTKSTMESANDGNITNAADIDDDDEKIRAVGEELLKRLQCNGTSISIRKSISSSDKISPKQTSVAGAPVTNDDVSLENPNSQITSKPLNRNNNSNKKNTNHSSSNNNISSSSSSTHYQNCQNQPQPSCKTMENVNSSRSSSSNCCTDVDGTKAIECNGTQPTSCATVKSESIKAINDDASTIPSCSYQSHDIHQPSTSYASVPTEMNVNTVAAAPATIPAVPKSALSVKSIKTDTVEVTFKEYENELQMPDIMRVIQRELSEPYSIYTYRYFIHNWPKLCFLAMDGDNCIGAIVCKLDIHRQMTKRGYIAMLAVDAAYRKLKVGTTLVQKAIEVFIHVANERLLFCLISLIVFVLIQSISIFVTFLGNA